MQRNCEIGRENVLMSQAERSEEASPDSSTGDGAGAGAVHDDLFRNIQKLDISAFPYSREPAYKDSVSHLFQHEGGHDYTALCLKPNHECRPLRVGGQGKLILEKFHPLASQVEDLLMTIAEPTSRPSFIHEYRLTIHSLYAATSVGLNSSDIIATLDRFSKNELPSNVIQYIHHSGSSYGMVKIVLKNNRYFVETKDPGILQTLLRDSKIGPCRVMAATEAAAEPQIAQTAAIAGTSIIWGMEAVDGLSKHDLRSEDGQQSKLAEVQQALSTDEDDDFDRDTTHSFQIRDDRISAVAERCLALHCPALQEYDFRNDRRNANLEIELRPGTQIRPYQEKSLTKMFGNGRAMSGIIVLPCGAGKTLVGVTAACTIKKGVVVLATSNMSALQWRDEFVKWSNISSDNIALFSSENKSVLTRDTGIIITTYSMVTNSRERASKSAEMMQFLQERDWGLMILDEVHVVPAQMFRRVIGSIKAHSKLGLTATLLREDDRIEDLNFLIGPKLYESNWMELSSQGYIAKVQCAEVWCAMPVGFFEQYSMAGARSRQLFCVMNPTKFQACQYLIRYHESRGDKIIVFSDNVYALGAYAKRLMKPFLYGGTGNTERQEILDYFRNSPKCSTLFLSKIGDTSLDLPEATCLIQISAQYGSRRQEAQRLGRILRAKRRTEEGFNAFFYSLVSKDTIDMVYSAKRQAFLIDQGYAFKVITRLKGIERTPGLAFDSEQARAELLQKVMDEIESRSIQEEETKEAEGLVVDGSTFHESGGSSLGKASERVAGTPNDVSRGQRTKHVGKNRVTNKAAKSKCRERSSFFKAIDREKNKKRKGDGTAGCSSAAGI